MEKSYVGMMVCFWCGEPKGIVLDRRLQDRLPHRAVYDYEPCEARMAKGITLRVLARLSLVMLARLSLETKLVFN